MVVVFRRLTRYIKVTLLRATPLESVPPEESEVAGTRCFHVYESDDLDEDQFASRVMQAGSLRGERL